MGNLNPASCWRLWFVLFTAMHYSCSPSAARSLGNETDRMALLDIKIQMNDPNGVLNSWNDSHHHCQWLGVSCDVRHQRVTNLTLQGKSLSGTISPYVGNLSFMKGIYLGGNSLHGEIPQQIGQLSRLRVFVLLKNSVSGKIPVNFSMCSRLRYLSLGRNSLIGEIPAELGSLTKLEALGINTNNLIGKIPASLGNLSSSLQQLTLAQNNLEGHVPTELGSLRRLFLLALDDNMLRGQIPSSLFNISTLRIFGATNNSFYGKLPINLGFNLVNLRKLFFSDNYFSGEIPVSISNCTKLEVVGLNHNKFEGTIPPNVGKLQNLQRLNLQDNSFQGNIQDILQPLTNCTYLTTLVLSYNNFSGKLSNNMGNLSSQLTMLYLGYNKISGIIPLEFGNLVGLHSLVLQENSLTGVIPTNLAKLQNLEGLYLDSNMLSGQIPSTLCTNMTNLYDLDLSDNNLRGDLNHFLANCQSLKILYLHDNKFSGSISSRIFGSYISPNRLILSNNLLSGNIPLEIGKLKNLQELYVSNNKLLGHIPSTVGDCSVLMVLDMHTNHFSGSLPQSLASLKGIEQLDLSDNTLTGPIPGGMSQLVYLKYLNLSYNDLEGRVPIDGVFSNASQIMLEGNSKLCGGIFELRLPPCPVVHRNTNGVKHFKIVLILLLFVLFISTTFFLYLFLRKKCAIVRTSVPPVPREDMLKVSYHDLYRATKEFSPACLIGSGSFGFVYKCDLVDQDEIKVVAVKVLDIQKKGASKSFMSECKALSNLRHRNLLHLLTYCSSIDHKGNEFKALVYKYMENGSLDTWLHSDQQSKCLNILQRLNIVIDIALALDHMHNNSHIAVVHCDVKPSNILLDNDLTAYVGDFGLARLLLPKLQDGVSSSAIAIKGTIGYAAPEYAMGLEVSTQGDVYSYGILLLEMFTGRRPTDDAFTEGLDLHNYVKTGLSNQVWKIVDPLLLSVEVEAKTMLNAQTCIISALNLGIGCSQGAAKDRMNMKQVTRELHFIRAAFCVA